MQQCVRNVCAKFKVDSLSLACTGSCQVFTIQKSLLSEIPLSMKTATLDTLRSVKCLLNFFLRQKKIFNVPFLFHFETAIIL